MSDFEELRATIKNQQKRKKMEQEERERQEREAKRKQKEQEWQRKRREKELKRRLETSLSQYDPLVYSILDDFGNSIWGVENYGLFGLFSRKRYIILDGPKSTATSWENRRPSREDILYWKWKALYKPSRWVIYGEEDIHERVYVIESIFDSQNNITGFYIGTPYQSNSKTGTSSIGFGRYEKRSSWTSYEYSVRGIKAGVSETEIRDALVKSFKLGSNLPYVATLGWL